MVIVSSLQYNTLDLVFMDYMVVEPNQGIFLQLIFTYSSLCLNTTVLYDVWAPK